MGIATGLTAARMLEIENASVVSGFVDLNGDLLLTTHGGTEFNAGHVKGEKGDPGPEGPAGAEGSVPLGGISIYGGTTPPDGYLFCHGQAVSRATYYQLFLILGTTYGAGDGATTFNIPDLRGRTPLGAGLGTASSSVDHPLGQRGGQETHTLTANEMPNHNHGIEQLVTTKAAAGGTGTTSNGGGSVAEGATGGRFGKKMTDENGASYTSYSGGGKAHNIMQPYLAVNYIIKAQSEPDVPEQGTFMPWQDVVYLNGWYTDGSPARIMRNGDWCHFRGRMRGTVNGLTQVAELPEWATPPFSQQVPVVNNSAQISADSYLEFNFQGTIQSKTWTSAYTTASWYVGRT